MKRNSSTLLTSEDNKESKSPKVSIAEHIKEHSETLNKENTTPVYINTLKQAKCYYPNEEEFKDPLLYIKTIRKEASQYGIIKIIPPKKAWDPKFSLDTKSLRFKTRIQKLNNIGGQTRANINYLKQLNQFYQQNNIPLARIPQCDRQYVDLYVLKKEVNKFGGVQKVCKEKKWAYIGRILGLNGKRCTSMSSALKNIYIKYILPYEEHIIYFLKKMENNKKNGADLKSKSDLDLSVLTCEICSLGNNDASMLLCDECEKGFHMYCMSPKIEKVPKCEFYCPECLPKLGKDFGFEEGQEYTLTEFEQKANSFKKEYFESNKIDPKTFNRDKLEQEFWKHVDSTFETAEVEYAADLHSTRIGSAFPTLERFPTKETYKNSPWNLNVMPNLPDCLLSYLDTNISGMTVPWVYFGMMFSTFCWHNEDHYTYSINYQHFGEPKTWYGIPGDDAGMFEQYMKDEMPELFEHNPDLLHQLVTLSNPFELVKKGIRVFTTDQNPGEFVVTFPKSYHAGFNQGFNCNEAINFALLDWIPYGREAVERYMQTKRLPVFSHDQLIYNVSLFNKNPETAKMLIPELDLIYKKHKEVLALSYEKQYVDYKEDFQCHFCNLYCFITVFYCSKHKQYTCIDHFSQGCGCKDEKLMLISLKIEELESTLKKNNELFANMTNWVKNWKNLLTNRDKIAMKIQEQFLHIADELQIRTPEYYALSHSYNKSKNLHIKINQLLVNIKTKATTISDIELIRHQNEADMLCSTSETFADLSRLVQKTKDLKSIILFQLDNETDVLELQKSNEILESFAVKLLDLEPLLKFKIKNITWFIKSKNIHRCNSITYYAILEALDEANQLNVSTSFKDYKGLLSLKTLGQKWRDSASRVIDRDKTNTLVSYDTIQELLKQPNLKVPFVKAQFYELSRLGVAVEETKNKILFSLSTIIEEKLSPRLLYNMAVSIYDEARKMLVAFPELNKLKSCIDALNLWREKGKLVFNENSTDHHYNFQEALVNYAHILSTRKSNTGIILKYEKYSRPNLHVRCEFCSLTIALNTSITNIRNARGDDNYKIEIVCEICSIKNKKFIANQSTIAKKIYELFCEAGNFHIIPDEYEHLLGVIIKLAENNELKITDYKNKSVSKSVGRNSN